MEDLLLRTCTSALQELAELRAQLRDANAKIAALETKMGQLTSASGGDAAAAAEPVADPDEAAALADSECPGLLPLCAVQDEALRLALAGACERGELWLELRELLRRARATDASGGGCAAEDAAREALREELRRGSVRAALYCVGPSGPSVTRELGAVEAALASGGDEAQALLLSPVFRQGCWPVVEAVLRLCSREAVLPTLKQVHRAARSLLEEEVPFRDIDILAALRSAPPGLNVCAAVAGGQVVVKCGPWQDAEAGACPPAVPLHCEGQVGADTDTGHLTTVCNALDSIFSSLAAVSEGAEGVDVLQLLPLLRDNRMAAALGLPEALATASGGSLQWAFDCRAAKAASSGGDGGTENTVGLSSTGYKETLTIVDDKTSQKTADPPLALAPPAATAALPAPPLAEAAPAAAPAPQLTAALAPPEEGDEQSEDALANPPEEEEDDGDPNEKTLEILEQQAAFLECFMEELKGDRPLLLSQLNNLYKMRSGEELHKVYKAANYEKLRDFLLDIPGLTLVGRGNRMQVKLGETNKLDEFQENLHKMQAEAESSGGNTKSAPQFWMPSPLPERVLMQIHELFLRSEGHEIPLRNFIATWNAHFANETLAYRTLGFRDVRGLLSQVSFIEKVGGKSGAKYVLKSGVETGEVPASAATASSVQAPGMQLGATGPAARGGDVGAVPPRLAPPAHSGGLPLVSRPPGSLDQWGLRQPPTGCAVMPDLRAGFHRQPAMSAMADIPDFRAGFHRPDAAPAPELPSSPMAPQQAAAMAPQQVVPTRMAAPPHQLAPQRLAPRSAHAPALVGTAMASGSQVDRREAMHVASTRAPQTVAAAGYGQHSVRPPGLHGDGGPPGQGNALGDLSFTLTPVPKNREAWRDAEAPDWNRPSGPARVAKGDTGYLTTLREVAEQGPQQSSSSSSRRVPPGVDPGAPPPRGGWQPAGMQQAAPGRPGPGMGYSPPLGFVDGTASVPYDAEGRMQMGSFQNHLDSFQQRCGTASADSTYFNGVTSSQSLGTASRQLASPHASQQGFRKDMSSPGLAAAAEASEADFEARLQDDDPPLQTLQRPKPAVPEAEELVGDMLPFQDDPGGPITVDMSPMGSGALGDNPVIRNRQKGLKKKGASFFVSSPGAFVSSESRDARLYVSKCDRESVLQMQMPHGIPSLVCDISAGKVMVTNHECNELFESNELNGLLAHYEIFSLIHEEDRDRVSQTLAYLLVSGHMRMSPEEFTIVTMLGSTRRVRAEGSCLIGTWWQLDMCLIGDAAAAT